MSTLRELRKYASSLGIKRYSRMKKSQLEDEIAKINDNSQPAQPQTCSNPDTTNNAIYTETAQEVTQTAQTEALYDDDSCSDFPGDNSSPDMDILECHEPDIIPVKHDKPGFTVVPSEHIERPEYTPYPDTITDKCLYTVIPACDFLAHNSAVAIVPYLAMLTALRLLPTGALMITTIHQSFSGTITTTSSHASLKLTVRVMNVFAHKNLIFSASLMTEYNM